jgi:hypothetical protein
MRSPKFAVVLLAVAFGILITSVRVGVAAGPILDVTAF